MMVARHFSAWYHATKRSVPSGQYDGLSERKAAPYKNHQRGSRNLYSLDEFAFRLRYSARLASARFSSEIDFCSFAVLIASQNEPSIWVSSAPIAARNTPRSRCSSALHQRPSNLSATTSASRIASRASEVRSARCKASAFSASQNGTTSVEPFARKSLIPCSIHGIPSAVSPEALRARPRKMDPIASQYTKLLQ